MKRGGMISTDEHVSTHVSGRVARVRASHARAAVRAGAGARGMRARCACSGACREST